MKTKITKQITPFVWLLPAFLLLVLFFVYPAVNTLYLSFFEKIDVKESTIKKTIKKIIIDEINSNSKKKQISYSDKVKDLISLRLLLRKIQSQYSLHFSQSEVTETITLKELIELTVLKLYQKNGEIKKFVWLKNYIRIFTDKNILISLRNNLLWLIFFTFFTILLGLLLAFMLEQINQNNLLKMVIFMPMAISYVASAVIWAIMYNWSPKTGTLNAMIKFIVMIFSFGKINYKGVAFLSDPYIVNFALIGAAVWIWTGFCAIIFSAALKSIPQETIESAKVEGATEFQIFMRITIPIIKPTIIVVTTTMVINVLKIFDIVYTLTGGGPYGASDVLANSIYKIAFVDGNYEYASALSVVLFIFVLPVLFFNLKHFKKERKPL